MLKPMHDVQSAERTALDRNALDEPMRKMARAAFAWGFRTRANTTASEDMALAIFDGSWEAKFGNATTGK